ncbi:MAG: hypothetical protein DWQ37_23280 [Planctomycetota bacterium]|nr:MAG: hypothetical protein DWQ37_23280 [Planctomycetota bacterium]
MQAQVINGARLTAIAPVLALCLVMAGCTSLPELPWAPVARDASAGFYETARLEYRLDAGKLGQPLDTVRVDGRHVGYEQIAACPVPGQSTATLLIQYPHPAGREGFARVTFSIDSSREPPESGGLSLWKTDELEIPAFGNHEEVHEVWALDIPRGESDRYFALLTERNFYDGQPMENGPAVLAATINGKRLEKPWERLPDLDALAQRVRGDGQLVAYIRPAALAGNTTSPIASTQAYRELLARTQESTMPGGVSGPADTRMARLPYASK